jgi:rifampicin phosphotransferase
LGLIRRVLRAAVQKLLHAGALQKANDIFQATPAEVTALLSGNEAATAAELSARHDEWLAWGREETPPAFGEPEPPPSLAGFNQACTRMNAAIAFYIAQMEARNIPTAEPAWSLLVHGIPASPGCYEGWARVIEGPEDFQNLKHGDVLIARTTSPAYNILLPLVGAVVTDRGGALCHTAIIAREFGLPAVVGASQATARIPDGARVFVDGDRGFVAVRAG